MSVEPKLKDIIDYIKYNQGIKQAEVAKRLGVRPTYLSDMINGRVPFSAKFKGTLYDVFSDCLNSKNAPQFNENSNQDKKGDASNENLDSDNGNHLVSLLPISAQGGSLNDFVLSVKDSDCEKVVSPIRGADFAMTVAGDSMAPEYPNGCQVLVKRINEAAFIEWGKAYVLDTCNGAVVKILQPSEREGCVRCASVNPDPKYAPFDVALGDVYGVYRVLMCMSMK